MAGLSEGGARAVAAAERERRRGQRAPFPGRKVESRTSPDRQCLRRSGRDVRAASCRRSLSVMISHINELSFYVFVWKNAIARSAW